MISREEDKQHYINQFPEYTFCPDICTYLNYKETEQNKLKPKPDHICLKYNTRVKHEIFHPKIIRCKECTENRTLEDEILEIYINNALKIENEYGKVDTLLIIIRLVDGEQKQRIINIILQAISKIEDDFYKTDSLLKIIPFLEGEQKEKVLLENGWNPATKLSI